MFYSHEILTSRQYGVATIWLVATIGNRLGTRRVSRKAIQEVDVHNACGKILEPGAPIALRLQGNLLYGVSRVYSQQYAYLVADAKKIQDQMQLFFNNFPGNQLDPGTVKARPESNMIEDDPAFDPRIPLPLYELETLVISRADTQKTSSQMSPLGTQLSCSHSPNQGFAIQLDIDRSSSWGISGSPFGFEGLSSAHKLDDDLPIFHQDDDLFGKQGDWGLEIDENGNIVESAEPMIVDEEPPLPPLPPIPVVASAQANLPHAQFDEQPIVDDQGDFIMQEAPLPDAEPFPEPRLHAPWQDDGQHGGQALARRRKKLQIDEVTQLSRRILNKWQSDYLEHCGAHSTRTVSATQAKRNAMLLTFGLGIASIGQNISVPGLLHPLAVEFSGDALFTRITGIEVEKRRRKRRTVSDATEDDRQQKGRRVKPRLADDDNEQEQAREAQEDDFMNLYDSFADNAAPELGREAEHPMSDHLSSTLLPWNRGSSAVPGSSAHRPNPAQQGRELSSPLGKRGDPLDIVRYSDDMPMGGFGSDGGLGGGIGSADSSFEGLHAPDLGAEDYEPGVEPAPEQIQAQNDGLFAQLDWEGQNFINYMEEAVRDDGEHRQDIDFEMGRKWVAFDDLFVPRDTAPLTAAHAFYHILCLITKDKMYVQQDGADHEPFGTIWVGMKV
ncbi:Rec8 like protein-domain-containing protein [Xylaria palmicola]|nr:Rec8 like protein-domain-containing protein [Xylaria palmicola]